MPDESQQKLMKLSSGENFVCEYHPFEIGK